jgi:MoaA/NifB/PqqE/SkfB family radical SAM enzyme
MIIAELVDQCNLACTVCPSRFREQTRRQMSLSTIEKILKIYPDRWIHWYSWGEPLLHKDFFKVADLIKESSSRISTNFSLKLDYEYFKAMRKFKMVTISLSGMTQEVYEINHKGGKLDLVMENIDKLLTYRLNPRDTVINWLSHKNNEFQKPLIEKFCKDNGIVFNSCPIVCTIEELDAGFEHELLQNPKFPYEESKGCRIVSWIPIDVDGNYLLCCASQNVRIGYTIDDNVSAQTLVKARQRTELCTRCREKGLWRMFS